MNNQEIAPTPTPSDQLKLTTFGERLKVLRELSELSQADLAKALWISQSAVSLYESNEREIGAFTADRVARYFGVSLDWLIGYYGTASDELQKKVDRESEDYK